MSKKEQLKQMTFSEKMDVLKNMHSRSAPDAKKKIEEWEEQMGRLQMKRDWLNHPGTKALMHNAMEQVKSINDILSSDADIDEMDRKVYFKLKEAHLVYLATLSADPEAEMRSIEQGVDYELQ